jgi:hypothetical protein
LVVICGGLDDVGGGSGDGLLRGRHDDCFRRYYVPLVVGFFYTPSLFEGKIVSKPRESPE